MVEKGDRLQELGEKYRILVENMSEGLWALDENMVTIFVNNKMCEIMGYSKDEILGKEVFCFFEGENEKRLRNELGKRRKGESSRYIIGTRTKKGKEIFLSVSGVPLVDKKGKFNGAFAIVSDITERKRLEDKRTEHTMELEKEVEERTGQLVDLYKGVAVTEERNRLAQEIHDGLAQTLASSLLKIDLCKRVLKNNQEAAKRELLELRNTLAKSIKETRHVIFELSLPRFHRTGFATVLKQYFEEFCRKTRVVCNLNLKLDKTLPTKIQVGIYRIIREAMNNIRKHAAAKRVDARLRIDKSGNLHLVIEDDGKGFDLKRAVTQSKHTKNFGLTGMKKQAKLLGGRLTISTGKGQGTRIKVKVPLEE